LPDIENTTAEKNAERKLKVILSTLKGQCHEFFYFRFFHESVSPKPLRILGYVQLKVDNTLKGRLVNADPSFHCSVVHRVNYISSLTHLMSFTANPVPPSSFQLESAKTHSRPDADNLGKILLRFT
jgi:hypothetical protein